MAHPIITTSKDFDMEIFKYFLSSSLNTLFQLFLCVEI